MSNVHEKLQAVQHALKAPKGQKNTFGNYSYRSAEDILQAVKPLLHQQGLTLTISDDIRLIGDRYYVEAKATITGGTEDDRLWVTAYAREEETKKGMDGSQITGAASSYARKYALNGLFAIDDTKDADSHDNRDMGKKPAKTQPADVVDPAAQLKVRLKKLLDELLVPSTEYADFFLSAIGKEKPGEHADYVKSIEHAETMKADEADAARELKERV